MRKNFKILTYISGTITILMFIGNISFMYHDSWDNSLYSKFSLIISFIDAFDFSRLSI